MIMVTSVFRSLPLAGKLFNVRILKRFFLEHILVYILYVYIHIWIIILIIHLRLVVLCIAFLVSQYTYNFTLKSYVRRTVQKGF